MLPACWLGLGLYPGVTCCAYDLSAQACLCHKSPPVGLPGVHGATCPPERLHQLVTPPSAGTENARGRGGQTLTNRRTWEGFLTYDHHVGEKMRSLSFSLYPLFIPDFEHLLGYLKSIYIFFSVFCLLMDFFPVDDYWFEAIPVY